jgi:hypothetical protein
MSSIPFNQRFGFEQSKPADNDFPENARIALAHLMVDLANKNYLTEEDLFNELLRTGRLNGQEFKNDYRVEFFSRILPPLQTIDWWRVYTFCERIYNRLLHAAGYFEDEETWIEAVNITEVRKYYTDELNIILAEDNIAYDFVNGEFQRRGRAQTQKNIQRVGAVLADPSLVKVRDYYNKARKFFDERPESDVENCIKEALCALEACLEILTKKPASKDFTKVVKQLQGNDAKQIPGPIVEGMIKLHGYRGSGQGVEHAALQGSKVSEIEAELVLSLVASYITYLVDLFLELEEEIPF